VTRSVTAEEGGVHECSRMGIVRSWVDWTGGNGLDVVEPQNSQKDR
jgi:hypothetical protein